MDKGEDVTEKVIELRHKAKQSLLRHDFNEACKYLTDALVLQPLNYKFYRLRCIAKSCLGRYEESLSDAIKVTELQPKLVDGYYHKGFSLYHLRDYQGAAHAFKAALGICPSDKVLQQGFWDSVTLMSQGREEAVDRVPPPDFRHGSRGAAGSSRGAASSSHDATAPAPCDKDGRVTLDDH